MEPIAKKAKITDHFRVALKPRDHNVHRPFSKQNLNIVNKNHNKKVINNDVNKKPELSIKELLQRQLTKNPKNPSKEQEENLNGKNEDKEEEEEEEEEDRENIELEDNLKASFEVEEITLDEDIGEGQGKLESNLVSAHDTKRNDLIITDEKLALRTKFKSNNKYIGPPNLGENIIDHDATVLDNVFCEPHYAWDSFLYDREREVKFKTKKYLDDHELNHQITPRIRARLIDWLVDIQNDFRLDHEPLYMAVKLVDQYLMRKPVMKQNLELLYMTSIFISVKFDYRPNFVTISELVQEFGGKYNRKQVINFEIDILSTLNFDIRFPLSYGFLRRFARCTNSNLQTLTLARYILESSLLEYEMIDRLESEIAAASLLLANRMLFIEISWSEAAEFYTGYKEKELNSLVMKLNDLISKPIDRRISAIRKKYSNEVFMSVANIAPLAT